MFFRRQKYRLTANTIRIGKHTLHQIVAVRNIGIAVQAGELGGFIEKHDNLSQEGRCWVERNAMVFGNARVDGHATVGAYRRDNGTIHVCGSALITDRAQVRSFLPQHTSKICDNALICGRANIVDSNLSGDVLVGGRSLVIYSQLRDAVRVWGDARLENCELFGNVIVRGNGKRRSVIKDGVRLGGDVTIHNRILTPESQRQDPALCSFLQAPDLLT